MGREVILITASWCPSCKAMQQWFFDMEIPGVTLKVLDIEEFSEGISSVPAVVLREDGAILQVLYGASDVYSLKKKICSIFLT
jgi:glutaredoxin